MGGGGGVEGNAWALRGHRGRHGHCHHRQLRHVCSLHQPVLVLSAQCRMQAWCLSHRGLDSCKNLPKILEMSVCPVYENGRNNRAGVRTKSCLCLQNAKSHQSACHCQTTAHKTEMVKNACHVCRKNEEKKSKGPA